MLRTSTNERTISRRAPGAAIHALPTLGARNRICRPTRRRRYVSPSVSRAHGEAGPGHMISTFDPTLSIRSPEQHHRVDLFAAGDNLPWSPKNHRPDVRYNRTWNPEQMRELFGAEHFRAGELLSEEHMVNVSSHTWPEIAHAQAVLDEKSRRMKSPGSIPFAYVYKIWRCGQLIHRSGVAYDVVIRMRPDLWPIRPFKLARAADGRFELQVGGRCVRFGSREVVVHALTNYCANDWLAIGTLDTMTVTMDLARFWTPASAFLSTDAALQQIFRIGVEPVLNFLWWRTGTKVLRRPLFVEIARLRCADPSCLRLPAWQLVPILQLPDAESKCTVLPSGKRSIPGVLQRGSTA